MLGISQIIGLVSAALTTTAFVPQAIKTWKTRSTSDLSPTMFLLFFVGIAGWLIYGLLVHDMPIIVANVVTICLAGIILYFIIMGKKTKAVSHVGIYVKDLEAQKEFYCTNFGATAGKLYTNQVNNFSSYFVRFPSGSAIELMCSGNLNLPEKPDRLFHIAISVGSKSEVDRVTSLLESMNLELLKGPRTTGDGYYESLFRDPEGILLEITE